MSNNRETAEMAEMRAAGWSLRRIGDVYGVAPSAVGQRLRRAEKTPVKLGTKTTRLDQNRLIFLYKSERLPILGIAAALSVSEGVIKRALKLHRIPPRPGLKPGGKYLDRMRKLAVGESVEIECPAKYAREVLRSTARLAEGKILIRSIGPARFQVTRIDPAETRETFELARIEKKSLEEMYLVQYLRHDQIAAQLGCGVSLITKALKFHNIAVRPKIMVKSKYSGVFRNLATGETAELECLAKFPVTNLHYTAHRIGIKISLRKSGAGKFKVTRIG